MSMQQRGFAFKLMAAKDIASVLGMLGVHPVVTAENIDKPNPELASTMYHALAEFAYDMDIQQLKLRAADVPSVGQYMEIFDEAIDIVAVFKLAHQLASINRVEDFSMRDIWDPQAKRLRAVLSGIINFCRYKESKTGVIEPMNQEVTALENVRLEMVDKSNAIGHELAEAQARHSAELQDMWNAENEARDATNVVEKLEKQKQTADRLFESADAKATSTKERLAENERRVQQLRDTIESLQEQVAESPEGLDQEVQELNLAIRQQKARVEEKGDEKRARTQRVTALARLKANTEAYKEALERVANAAAAQTAACDRTRGARNELGAMRSALEARSAEEVDLVQAMEQVNQDTENAKQAYAEAVRDFEERKALAIAKQGELQGKRTEEQREWSALQTQREQIESEIANVRRAYEAETNDFHASLRAMQEDGEAYVQTIESLTAQCDDEAGREHTSFTGARPTAMPSPGSGHGRRRSSLGAFSASPGTGLRSSPAPRRLIMGSGY